MVSRLLLVVVACAGVFAVSCKKTNYNEIPKVSRTTGKAYAEAPSQPGSSDTDFGPVRFKKQDAGQNMVFIEGGTFHMGGAEEDIGFEQNNRERQVTVHSFYMHDTEVSNVDWKEFVHYYERDSGAEKTAYLKPDTTVWFRDLAYNEPFVELYYQHPAYGNYPVVGVSWFQANEYCKWLSNTSNRDVVAKDANAALYPHPKYRLPTEGEWEYAARGLLEQELYPWEGKSVRNEKGRFRANMKRGRGDYAGRSAEGASNIPGDEGLNDGYMIPGPIQSFYATNDFGLFNMAGNVAEWTMDTYRVLAYEDVNDFQPFRRKGTTDKDKDKMLYDNDYGERANPDRLSLLHNPTSPDIEKRGVFNPASMNSGAGDWDRIKIYRGGAWADVAYYQSCGTRRFFNADSSSSSIGFRYVKSRVGSPSLKY